MAKYSKKKFRELLNKNLKHAGYVKESYGDFRNYFLDKLTAGSDDIYYSLRSSANLSRNEVAKILQISPRTIERYERDEKAPHWYFLMLRLLNGDLSFYGNRWRDCTIQTHDRKLRNPHSTIPLEPFQMNQNYNRIALDAKREARKERKRSEEMLLRIEAFKKINAELLIQNEILQNRVNENNKKKLLIESGKIIPMFKAF